MPRESVNGSGWGVRRLMTVRVNGSDRFSWRASTLALPHKSKNDELGCLEIPQTSQFDCLLRPMSHETRCVVGRVCHPAAAWRPRTASCQQPPSHAPRIQPVALWGEKVILDQILTEPRSDLDVSIFTMTETAKHNQNLKASNCFIDHDLFPYCSSPRPWCWLACLSG